GGQPREALVEADDPHRVDVQPGHDGGDAAHGVDQDPGDPGQPAPGLGQVDGGHKAERRGQDGGQPDLLDGADDGVLGDADDGGDHEGPLDDLPDGTADLAGLG